ncbi:MAG: Bax inhibitor-1/YccA family protein [Alphaproteobacteria bacterium]|nr:Bax inhibitor-1/YccA family protein [Alphaproteobacteria bacterium]
MQNDRYGVAKSGTKTVDAGLQSYMQRVYNVMALGLVFTGAISYFVAATPAFIAAVQGTFLGLIVALAPLGIIFFGLNPRKIQGMSVGAVTGLYFLLTGLFGVSLSYIFLVYSSESIARVFFITAGMFAATSIYGYTTKKDLTSLGSLMFMGLIGIIIAGVVNIFLHSAMLHFVTSAIGVVVFTGLTAWDTQRIKETYHVSYGRDALNKIAVMGALSLYLDFINLFVMMLRLFGGRD